MTIYLTIITTVLVLTQIIRITQNTIQLRRQNVLYGKQLKELADYEIGKADIDRKRKVYKLLDWYLTKKVTEAAGFNDDGEWEEEKI